MDQVLNLSVKSLGGTLVFSKWFSLECAPVLMERLHLCGILLFVLICRGTTATYSLAQSPSYLVSVSEVLRCGVPTVLSVSILSNQSITVSAELLHGNTSVSRTNTTVPAGSTRLLSLPPVYYEETSYWFPYQLNVEGFLAGVRVFSNSSRMLFSPKCLSIFIQTDRKSFQPGQTLRFRVLMLTPEGQPYSRKIDIFIRVSAVLEDAQKNDGYMDGWDPKGNMVRQWLAVDAYLGVVSKDFNFSQNPPLGTWRIIAGINDVVHEKTFAVENSVFPRFQVKVSVPSVLYYKDSLTGTVTAKYFYGKPVIGVMSVMFVHGYNGLEKRYRLTETIAGSAEITFQVPYLHKRFADYSYSYYEGYGPNEFVDIVVNVTESATGLVYNSSTRVTIVMNIYNLEFLEYPQVIKPSMTFNAKVKLSSLDQRPLPDVNGSRFVSLAVTQHPFSPWSWMMLGDEGPLFPRMMNVTDDPLSGIYNIPVQQLELPVAEDGARFEDSVQHLQLYQSYFSPSKSYIQLHRDSEPQVGEPLKLTVQSNFNLSHFHYLVMSRGRLLDAGTVHSSSFSLNTQHLWTPVACLTVFHTLPDGEIVNDVLEVTFTQVLRNTVSVLWSQDRAEPGDSVTLSVSLSEAGSLLGLLVVDKATLNSTGENGLSEKMLRTTPGFHSRTKEETESIFLQHNLVNRFDAPDTSVLCLVDSIYSNNQIVLEEFLSYSREMSNTDSSSMKLGDPYSIFTTCGVTVLTDARLNQDRFYDQNFPVFPGEGHSTTETNGGGFQEPRERKEFPETWIWLDANVSSDSTSFSWTVPDSLTTWVAFAIVMSENLGLGISSPAELTVFKDFFLSLNLPPFLIRGELLLLEVNLFNYMDVDLEVMVVVAESRMFEFVSVDQGDLSMNNVKKVMVWSQNITTLLFPIRAQLLGEIPISIKATSLYSSDWIHKSLLVKAEGQEQSFSETLFLEFELKKSTLSRTLSFSFPPDLVSDSQRASVSVVGDVLGPSIGNLDSLVEMPYGCGEQNMIHFAPNVYVLQYLKSTRQVQEETRSRAMSFMMDAYERELSYQRFDGSFSAFGDSDDSGSTWLSAFVLRCFLQAQPFISIDPLVMGRTVLWLVAHQELDGSFGEPGRVIHTELQGEMDGPCSLTAYVLIALLEDEEYRSMYGSSVSSAVRFLSSRLAQGVSSNYSLSLVTYALSLANSSTATFALTTLMNRAVVIDGVPTWRSPGSIVGDSWQPGSADIEIAAYVLLSMHQLRRMDEGFFLMKWLSQQRNPLGGFGSTQDTVMALHALSVYATFRSSESMDLRLSVSSALDPITVFFIDKHNYLLQQSQNLPIESEQGIEIEVEAAGKGFALVQLSVFYNVKNVRRSFRRHDPYSDEAFFMFIDVMDDGDLHVKLHVCFRLNAARGLNQTGMSLLDVALLTGFSLAPDSVQMDQTVRRVETPPGRIILYLDSVSTVEKCIEISTVMDYKVTSVQDAVIMIYDYYEPRRRTVRSYTSETRRDMSVCSLCGSECSLCGVGGVSDDGMPSVIHPSILSMSLAMVLILLIC
ncbi:hypothetical protein DNTS_035848 [Danionella cerebrum]|uniref:CD109 antigen n=1 Tax=Danionella cerebrum TaxID=2873325 RepID=A0A553Q3J8_9TELE|nr:hypothetical protein DNTS_035848 [Danionella translucida]TRY84509.1 hypothetical protein DNTS_035848 [Danionella translucida]